MGKIFGILFVDLISRSRSEVNPAATDRAYALASRKMAAGSPFLHKMLISGGARSSSTIGVNDLYLKVTGVKT